MKRVLLTALAVVYVLPGLGSLSENSAAEVYQIDLSAPPQSGNPTRFHFGTAKNPNGVELGADEVSLLENGNRITPVMGEFHYSRYPHSEWRDELLKMKAGGINVVSTYVFWIHHEEIEGQWDWTGDRDLCSFVRTAGEVGLWCIVRCGPWDHGEVRNGGLPEWLLDQGIKVRSDDPAYLKKVDRLYAAISDQLAGLLWKDGGPVIGIQIENEFHGETKHLLTLKQKAIDAGLDVPFYTRTGWPELRSPLPFGELLPLYGGYAEGFWDRDLKPMPGRYWQEFLFKLSRSDAAIATDHFGDTKGLDEDDVRRYPYLTCEIGPGMMSSYHRRISVFPLDVLSMVIVKLGSGSNSPGYYMYHGGTNPVGREPWLQENQRSRYTNYNDLPVKSYDFQTAIGEFGQIREQYHLLRNIHLFLQDFGERLAPMGVILSEDKVKEKQDSATFRWAVRTDGHSGFVFVNNYQRLLPMPARPETQLKLQLKDGDLTFPKTATTVAADSAFFWPFNFDLGDGITLDYATAQPVCQVRNDGTVYSVFVDTGNPAEFAFSGQASVAGASDAQTGERVVLTATRGGTAPFATLTATNGKTHHVILLEGAAAKQCYKGRLGDAERLILTSANVMIEGETLRLNTTEPHDIALALLPAPAALSVAGQPIDGVTDGLFTRYSVSIPNRMPVKPIVELVRKAGPLRKIQLGKANVAEAPTDAEFDQAAVWRIRLPNDLDPSRNLLLRVSYTGDVARAYLGNTLLTDNFYNGTPFEIGLRRFGPNVISEGITLKVLPLQREAPVFMLDSARPQSEDNTAVAKVHSVEVVESREIRLSIGH